MRRTMALTIAVLALCALPADTAEFSGAASWYEGADGFERAVETAEQEGKALMVYFRTDWCPYCRQFEEELLSTEEVNLFLSKVIPVTVNPESGRQEEEIASAYGVRGYPAVFMHPAGLEAPRRISRTRVVNGKPQLQSPVEFVQTLARAATK